MITYIQGAALAADAVISVKGQTRTAGSHANVHFCGRPVNGEGGTAAEIEQTGADANTATPAH